MLDCIGIEWRYVPEIPYIRWREYKSNKNKYANKIDASKVMKYLDS